MTMIMKASPAVKAILKVLTTKTTTGLKLRVRKYAPFTLPRIFLCPINWGTQWTMKISSNE